MTSPSDKNKITKALAKLEFNWQLQDKALLIEVDTKDFAAGVWLIDEIAKAADELNHHPDLKLENYSQLTIRLSTHDADDITEKDLSLAQKIDAILSRAKDR